MRRVRFHALARRELDAATAWYDNQVPGAGKRLLDEIDGTLRRIASAPEHGSPHLYGTRRLVLEHFPYSNVYLALDHLCHIIAIAHHRRRPGYWRKRLKSI